MTGRGDLGYVPGLDGIRALAVMAVLVFHADLGVLTGGYLGVSVFFTLSGYLITTLLLREHQRTGTVGLAAFYGRRMRRLLPAAYLCIAAAIALSPWWTDGQRRHLPGDVITAVGNVFNWRAAFATRSYQDLFEGGVSPLAHFWSLSIEEQCYLAVPLLVVVALRRSRLALAAGASLLAMASFVATMVIDSFDLRYNATFTRAGELLVGVVLAVVRMPVMRHRNRGADVAGLIGLVGLAVLMASVPLDAAFLARGGFAVVAVLSAMVIVGVMAGTLVPRWLSARPLPAIGRVSYGVYLFHWPINLLLTPARVGVGGWSLFAVRTVVTFGVAVLSFRVIEQPVRAARWPMVDTLLRAAATAAVLMGATMVIPRPQAVFAMPTTDQAGVVDFGSAASVPATVAPDFSGPVLVVGTDPSAVDHLRAGGLTLINGLTCSAPGADTTTCASSPAEWAALAARHRPKTVIVALANETGTQKATTATNFERLVAKQKELVKTTKRAVGGMFDLTPRPAVIVYNSTEQGGYLDAVMTRIVAAFPQVATARTPADLDTAFGLGADALPAVLILGDSTSLGLARAIDVVASSEIHGVWAGATGCPMTMVTETRLLPRGPWVSAPCKDYTADAATLVRRYRPRAVIIMASVGELMELRYADASTSTSPTDPVFVRQHDDTMDRLFSAFGDIPVLIADSPDLPGSIFFSKRMLGPRRVAMLNEQIARWVAAHPTATLLPYRKLVSDYEAVNGNVRTDGVHLDAPDLEAITKRSILPLLRQAMRTESPPASLSSNP